MATIEESYKIEVPPSWITKAERMASKRISTEYKRDVRLTDKERLEKIIIGYIGEFAFSDFCNKHIIPNIYLGRAVENKPDEGDFKMCNNIIIDVKTQENSYSPREDWRCEVTNDQLERLPESSIYVFNKLYKKEIIYLVGWITKIDFRKSAKYRKAGDILVGKPVHYPKWDITISELNSMSTFHI